MRTEINAALKQAVKDQNKLRSATLRLINAAIKDRDIAARVKDQHDGVSDDEILEILAKMVKQRTESAVTYEEAGRLELAEQERQEITIIQEFMPKQLDEDEVMAVIDAAIAATEAQSLKDMGRIMGHLKEHYAGQMDFGKAGGLVKARLG